MRWSWAPLSRTTSAPERKTRSSIDLCIEVRWLLRLACAVLHPHELVTTDEVEIRDVACRESVERWVGGSDVPLVPDRRDERIGVGDHETIRGLPSEIVLEPALRQRDAPELVGLP